MPHYSAIEEADDHARDAYEDRVRAVRAQGGPWDDYGYLEEDEENAENNTGQSDGDSDNFSMVRGGRGRN